MLKEILALIGVVACIGLAINTVVIVILAAFNKGKLDIDLTRCHELWFEVPLVIIILPWGIWGIVYIISLLLK
jgi:hypothetical protein